MEIDDLEAKVRGARTLMHTIGNRVFTLVAPTAVQCDRAFMQAGVDAKAAGLAGLSVWRRQVVEQSLTQWAGVTEDDVLPPECRSDETAATPLAWSPRALTLYLDANPDDAIALGERLFAHMSAQRAAFEAARKN